MFQSKMYHDTGRIDSSNILDSLQKFKSGGGGEATSHTFS